MPHMSTCLFISAAKLSPTASLFSISPCSYTHPATDRKLAPAIYDTHCVVCHMSDPSLYTTSTGANTL